MGVDEDACSDDGSCSIGSSSPRSASENDEDYVPEKAKVKGIRKKKKRKRKRIKSPDMTELSLPKPAVRLSQDLDLSGTAVVGAFQVHHTISKLGNVKLPKDAPAEANARTVKGFRVTRGTPDDPRVAQYRIFYAKQLPGMPFYDDEYHVTLTLDGADREVVSAAATFSFVDLTTNDGERLLILDVLALAVNPGKTERRGVGSLVVQSLKAICRQEAAALSARPLLLTQADLACVGFWAKGQARALGVKARPPHPTLRFFLSHIDAPALAIDSLDSPLRRGFARALDANALVRSLRRASGATIFTGAVPMAHLMEGTAVKPARVTGSYAASTAAASAKRLAEEAARALRMANRP